MAAISCSDDLRDGGTPALESAHITVCASKGDAETRSILSEENGNLNCAWTDGDQLLVTDVNGGTKGILELTDVNAGKFEGTLMLGVTEGKVTLRYFYLGNGVDPTNVSQKCDYDIAAQDGTIESLSNNDALSAQAEIAVINGGAYPDGTLQLERHFSFAHFTLKLPEGVTLNGEPVTISGNHLLTKATLGLADRAISEQTAGTITVNPGKNSFYVNIIPANEVAPVFTVTINGKEYVGKLNARDIAAGKFLRKKDGDNDSGVTVDMTVAGGDEPSKDDMVGPEFKIDGKKYRFTSGNLYYNTKTGVWGIHERQTDFTNAGGLDLQDGPVEKTPELIGLFAWGATGLEDAQKPTTLKEALWQQSYDGHYFPSTAGQSKNSTIKTLWSNEYVYDWGRAYMESGRAADDDRQYLTPSTEIFTALMKSGFVQGATIKGAAYDGSDVVGLIVIPDVNELTEAKDFIRSVEGASCLSSMPAVIHNNSGNTFNYKNITLDSYDVLKKLNDAVFFPAADKRNLTDGKVYESKDMGWYWSSTSNTTTNGYNLFFNGKSGGFAYNGSASSSSMGRFNQMAVRLLVEVK